MSGDIELDELDQALLAAMHDHPERVRSSCHGSCESRVQRCRRGWKRLEDSGVIAGYEPRIGLAAAGFGVQAFVTLEIAQGALDRVSAELAAIPGVLEAYATTGSGDVVCHIAAESHERLQQTLIELNHSGVVQRSTSVVALSTVVPYRVLPLLQTRRPPERSTKAPAFRRSGPVSG